MKKKLLLLLLMFIPFFINAEEVKLEWQKSWGGNDSDLFDSIVLTNDGGFIVTGAYLSTDIEGFENKGKRDFVIVKYDEDGNLLWQRRWGGNDDEWSYSAVLMEDGNIIVPGYSYSTDIEGFENKGKSDAVILKYDQDGNLLWQKTWGGNDSDLFDSIVLTNDGGFIVTGAYLSTDIEGFSNKGDQDVIMIKYDKDGNIIWQKTWGGNDFDSTPSIHLTSDEGFTFTTYSLSTDLEGITNKGIGDIIVGKFNKDGNLLWHKNWGGNNKDFFRASLLTKDESIIITSYSTSTDIEGIENSEGNVLAILKYDKDGNFIWQQSWGGDGIEEFRTIYLTEEDEILIPGYTSSKNIEGIENNLSKAVILKYDQTGNLLMQKSWGGSNSNAFNSIIFTKFGGYIAEGYSNSTDIDGIEPKGSLDHIFVKYGKNDNLLSQKSWGGESYDSIKSITLTQSDGFVAIGSSPSTDIEGIENKGKSDAVILKYSIKYNLEDVTKENGNATTLQQGKYGIIKPTPNEGYEVDDIIVKDVDGNVLDVEVTKLEDGTYSFELYEDVSVEVLFKEKFVNPKTGLLNYGAILSLFMLLPILALVYICRYNQKYGL